MSSTTSQPPVQVLVQSMVHSFDGSCLETVLVEQDWTGLHVLEKIGADAEEYDLADAGLAILAKDAPLHAYADRIGDLHITKAQDVQVTVDVPTIASTDVLTFPMAVQANLGNVRAALDAYMQGKLPQNPALEQHRHVLAALASSGMVGTSLVLLWDAGISCCQHAHEAAASDTPILDLLSAEPVLVEDTMTEALKLKLAARTSLSVLKLEDTGSADLASTDLQEQGCFWVVPHSSMSGLRKQLMVLQRVFAAGLLCEADGPVLDPEELLEDAVDIIQYSTDMPQVGCNLRLAPCIDPVYLKLHVGTSSPEDDHDHHKHLVFSGQDASLPQASCCRVCRACLFKS